MPEHTVLLPLSLAGLDLSITTTVAWTFVASLLLFLTLAIASRRAAKRPWGMAQVVMEYAVEFVEKQILEPVGLESRAWLPLILSLFVFVLFNNLMGVIPGAHAATGNINQTGALAALVFVIGYTLMFRRVGIPGFAHSLVPEGVKGPILILLVPIELVSQVLRPFSLAVRLFANMSGDHLLLVTIIGFTVLFGNVVVDVLSVGGAVVIFLFEVFVALMQAYIFAFLSALMISQCLAEVP